MYESTYATSFDDYMYVCVHMHTHTSGFRSCVNFNACVSSAVHIHVHTCMYTDLVQGLCAYLTLILSGQH